MIQPGSSDFFDNKVENFLRKYPQKDYLDVGPGYGKYGKMIRDLYDDVHITAVEPDKNVIKDCKLNTIYDKVLNKSADELIGMYPDFVTDVVIMGDVIEHMKKSEGLDLLSFLSYRSKYIFIIYPFGYLQYGVDTPFDAHISTWFPWDFEKTGLEILSQQESGYERLVVLKGYLQVFDNNPNLLSLNDQLKKVKRLENYGKPV